MIGQLGREKINLTEHLVAMLYMSYDKVPFLAQRMRVNYSLTSLSVVATAIFLAFPSATKLVIQICFILLPDDW